jgi:hypothetical protein
MAAIGIPLLLTAGVVAAIASGSGGGGGSSSSTSSTSTTLSARLTAKQKRTQDWQQDVNGDYPALANLSKGEKANRKRMAEVAAVYTVKPVPRSPAEVMASPDQRPKEAPEADNKWLTASVVDDAATVIAKAFAEADRRDPDHAHPWVALVDGNNHQITRIKAEAKKRNLDITIVVGLIHVLGYLWDAAWCFYTEGDAAAEEWVGRKAWRSLKAEQAL